jgi:hypothetical protein
MATPFRPRANLYFGLVLGGLAFTAAALPTALWVWMRTPYATGQFVPRQQPVPFDHRHHVQDDGIGCLYCHWTAERTPTAGVPPVSVCMNCHSQVWTASPLLAPVRRAHAEQRPLVWARVNELPDHVYFDHSAHLAHGVGCVECHGRVDEMPLVSQQAPLQMHWCLDCHRDPAPHLRPRDKVADMAWQPPAGVDREAYGRRLEQELGVRHLTHCSTCHR